LILVQGERHGSSFSFLHADTHFSLATFVEEAANRLLIFNRNEKFKASTNPENRKIILLVLRLD
jgi:hypothetical protein